MHDLLSFVHNNPKIRNIHQGGNIYYSVIDFIAEVQATDFFNAQNYFHTLHGRIKRNGEVIPDAKPLKAKALDGKNRNTLFTSITGLEYLLSYIEPNLKKRNYRIYTRRDDEIQILHKNAIAYFETEGYQTKHHVPLPSGNIIDIVALLPGRFTDGYLTLIVECKTSLPKGKLYEAIGQVMCYRAEYHKTAIGVIVTFKSEITLYALEYCGKLGLMLLGMNR